MIHQDPAWLVAGCSPGCGNALAGGLASFRTGVTVVPPRPSDAEWPGRNAIRAPRATHAIIDAVTGETPREQPPLGAMACDSFRRRAASLTSTLADLKSRVPSMLHQGEPA